MPHDELLTPNEAFRRLLEISSEGRREQHAEPEPETVPLRQALGRVSFRKIRAPGPSPRFDRASRNGYALRSDDASWTFRLVDSVTAGNVPERAVGTGECVRVTSGAMMPEGSDLVVRTSYTREEDGLVTLQQFEAERNVIAAGSYAAAEDTILGPKLLEPADIATLASFGIGEVEVATPPRIALIATGSELREPGSPAEDAERYESTRHYAFCTLTRQRLPVTDHGIVPDHPERLADAVRDALSDSELVLLLGGISGGPNDRVRQVLSDMDMEVELHHIALKPGGAMLTARSKDVLLLGLPGDPVASLVAVQLFVLPYVYHRMGIELIAPHDREQRGTPAELAAEIARTEAQREEYRPVRVAAGLAQPVEYHGQGHIGAFAAANAFVRIDRGVHILEAGTRVDTYPFA
jgi:molybdopterin molybdotransferase